MYKKEKLLAAIVIIIPIIVLLFIAPWLTFWLSYFMGWIAKITIGHLLVEGFGLLGLTIPLAKIPLIAGVIGWIASFFHGMFNLKSSSKKEA